MACNARVYSLALKSRRVGNQQWGEECYALLKCAQSCIYLLCKWMQFWITVMGESHDVLWSLACVSFHIARNRFHLHCQETKANLSINQGQKASGQTRQKYILWQKAPRVLINVASVGGPRASFACPRPEQSPTFGLQEAYIRFRFCTCSSKYGHTVLQVTS